MTKQKNGNKKNTTITLVIGVFILLLVYFATPKVVDKEELSAADKIYDQICQNGDIIQQVLGRLSNSEISTDELMSKLGTVNGELIILISQANKSELDDYGDAISDVAQLYYDISISLMNHVNVGDKDALKKAEESAAKLIIAKAKVEEIRNKLIE